MQSIVQQCDVITGSPKSSIDIIKQEKDNERYASWSKDIQNITSYLRSKSKLDVSTTIFRNNRVRINWPTRDHKDINSFMYQNGFYKRLCGCREEISQSLLLQKLCDEYFSGKAINNSPNSNKDKVIGIP